MSALAFSTYAAEENTYTVTWQIGDYKVTEQYQYGETPSFKSNVPYYDEELDYYLIPSGERLLCINGWNNTIGPVKKNVTYVAQASQCYFSFTDTVDGETATVYYTEATLGKAFSLTKGVAHVKLYDDVFTINENPFAVPKGKTLYLDLNGYYYSRSGYGNDNNNKMSNFIVYSGATFYLYSSREGGRVYNSYLNWAGGSPSSQSAAVFGIGTDAKVYMGEVTYDGITYPGDNLSIYTATMIYSDVSARGAMYINGGTYNATLADAAGMFVVKSKDFVIEGNDALITSASAAFFRMGENEKTNKEDAINLKFKNCIFKSDSSQTTALIYGASGEIPFKIRFDGCTFMVNPNTDFVRWTYVGAGCSFPIGADTTTLRFDEGLYTWQSDIERKVQYNANTFSFDDKSKGVSIINDSSFVPKAKTGTLSGWIYFGEGSVEAQSSVVIGDGFEYHFYLPKSAYGIGGRLTLDGVETDYTVKTETVEGEEYYVIKIARKNPINTAKTVVAELSATRLNGKPYTAKRELSVARYMDVVISDEELIDSHTLAYNYLKYVDALCDYKKIDAHSLKKIIIKHADKFEDGEPIELGEITEDLTAASKFFHSVKINVSNEPKLVFLVKPNAQGSARLTYTDIDGAEKTVLVERSLLTETETDNGLVYKKFEIPLGTKINFSVTIKTFSSGAETGTAVYNLATYVNRIEKTNPSAYTREFVNLIERMAMFFDELKNQTQNN